jgi:hypothetical protein
VSNWEFAAIVRVNSRHEGSLEPFSGRFQVLMFGPKTSARIAAVHFAPEWEVEVPLTCLMTKIAKEPVICSSKQNKGF